MISAFQTLRGSRQLPAIGRTACKRYMNKTSSAGSPVFDSSVAAHEYKLSHAREPQHLQALDSPQKTVEEAVSSILYNMPKISKEPFKRHILNALVQNESGVLARVSSTLAARGFNIDSLVVCSTEVEGLSRLCLTLRGQDAVLEQARRQLEDLVPVWAVLDYTKTPIIERELLLCKISLLGPENYSAHMPAQESANQEDDSSQKHLVQAFQRSATKFHPGDPSDLSNVSSQSLKWRHDRMSAISLLSTQFGGKIVDVSPESLIVELTGKTKRVDAFLSLVKPYGIIEAARSGLMAMPRAPVVEIENADSEEREAVDVSLLPPG